MKLFLLYIITNLGPSFTFEYIKTVAAYSKEETCNKDKERLIIQLKISPPMRMECKSEAYYVN